MVLSRATSMTQELESGDPVVPVLLSDVKRVCPLRSGLYVPRAVIDGGRESKMQS